MEAPFTAGPSPKIWHDLVSLQCLSVSQSVSPSTSASLSSLSASESFSVFNSPVSQYFSIPLVCLSLCLCCVCVLNLYSVSVSLMLTIHSFIHSRFSVMSLLPSPGQMLCNYFCYVWGRPPSQCGQLSASPCATSLGPPELMQSFCSIY